MTPTLKIEISVDKLKSVLTLKNASRQMKEAGEDSRCRRKQCRQTDRRWAEIDRQTGMGRQAGRQADRQAGRYPAGSGRTDETVR